MNEVNGSVEIISARDRIGVIGVAWSPEVVPTVMQVLHGITRMEAEEPEERPTGRIPIDQWRGVDPQGQEVKVLLWEEIPFEETLAARIGPELVKE